RGLDPVARDLHVAERERVVAGKRAGQEGGGRRGFSVPAADEDARGRPAQAELSGQRRNLAGIAVFDRPRRSDHGQATVRTGSDGTQEPRLRLRIDSQITLVQSTTRKPAAPATTTTTGARTTARSNERSRRTAARAVKARQAPREIRMTRGRTTRNREPTKWNRGQVCKTCPSLCPSIGPVPLCAHHRRSLGAETRWYPARVESRPLPGDANYSSGDDYVVEFL